ncbi:MAG: class I SAM-dependent methyltransferase [Ardenticatenia bacterium]|nr:class I SAM-dependent methyltransferase [Ardenticatenia bacterium]
MFYEHLFCLQHNGCGWQVAGIEVSKQAAAIARKLTGAPIWVGSVNEFHSDKTFDAITAWEVLEHLPDPADVIEILVGLLKPGGFLALSVPNWSSPWMRSSAKNEHWPPYHLTFWDRNTLYQLLSRAGLNDISVAEKPFAWEEEVGRMKWLYLPIALLRSFFWGHKGMHLYAIGRRL